MKTILSILFLTAFGCYGSQAQTATSTSSAKNVQTQVVTEAVQPAATEATLVSGEKQADVKKVPLENNTVVPETKGTTSSARKPD